MWNALLSVSFAVGVGDVGVFGGVVADVEPHCFILFTSAVNVSSFLLVGWRIFIRT